MVTNSDYEACRTAIGFLKQQTALDHLELILVAPSRAALRLDEADVEGFPFLQVVEVEGLPSTGIALAAGVRAARADWVNYCEEHSYPEPGWAEALIAPQQGPWAMVGSAMSNANPGTYTSWAALLGEFGPVVVPVESGEIHYLGPHHASYRRDLLLAFGDMLEPLLEFEAALHDALRAQGHRLYLAADAVSSHVNLSQPGSFIKSDFLGQRGFGSMRWQGQGWSWPRRLFYAAASPLIPPLRLARSVKDVRRCSKGKGLVPWIYPIMAVAMVAGAVGEALGYLFGTGRAAADRLDLELDRNAFIVEADRVKTPRTMSVGQGE